MNAPTDWTTPLIILIAAVILGALIAFALGKRRIVKAGDDLVRKDLEAKRDALIQELRDSSISDDERRRLEAETANVLRELDARPAPPTAPANRQPPTVNPTIKGFLWGAGSFAALAGLTGLVVYFATPRQEGGSLTGNTPMQGQQQPMQQQPQQPDAILQQIETAVQRDPNNLALRNDLAQAYLERENLMAVFEQTKFVLEKSPNDSRALTFQALVRMAMGERDTAQQMLQRASESDPKNLDAWVARAWVYVQDNKISEAEKMIAEAARQSPKDAPRLQEVLAQMKAHATMAASQPQQPAQAAQGAAPAAAGPKVTVTLDIDPAASSKTGIVFVMARNPAGGPPVAVKRLQVASFPITFDLSSADSMMGQQLPDKFRLEARLDSDGDAATKLPTDPTALQNDVAPGANVRLALK